MTKYELIIKVAKWSPRSAWGKDVKTLMLMLVDQVESEADVNLEDIINICNRPQDRACYQAVRQLRSLMR